MEKKVAHSMTMAFTMALSFLIACPVLAESLADKLVSKNEETRDAADSQLGDLSEAAKAKLVPELTTHLKNKDPYVRYYAARAIGQVGPAAQRAIPVLVKLMSDQGLDGNVGLAATDVFQNIGPTAIPYLIKALTGDKEMETRRNAASALGDFGPQAKEAVPHLIKAAEGKDLGLKQSAIRALGRIGPEAKQAVPALAKALNDKDALARSHAQEALESIATPEAMKALEKKGK